MDLHKTSIFLILLAFLSCNTVKVNERKAGDIRLSELITACDYADAMVLVVEEGMKIKGTHSLNDLTLNEKQELQKLRTLWKDITRSLKKKRNEIKEKDFESCESVNGLSEDFKKAFRQKIETLEFD